MSKEQDKLKSFLRSDFINVKPIENYRPDFLKNPHSDSNLEIDIFYPNWRIGFEYQGAIHFKKIDSFRNNPDKARNNDVIKQDLINKKKNTCLVEIFHSDIIGDMKSNILNRIVNMQEYYILNKQIMKTTHLELLYLCAVNCPKQKGIQPSGFRLYDTINRKMIDICYRSIDYLKALQKCTEIWKSKNGIERSIKYMAGYFLSNKHKAICSCNDRRILTEYFFHSEFIKMATKQ